MQKQRLAHPLAHHPAFRAVIAAAPSVAELATSIGASSLVGTLAIACSDLADGFAAPPESRRRIASHHRAWVAVRELDRIVGAARRSARVPAAIVTKAQRAIDRADVLVGALLPA